jgi:hypothetical protein
VTGNNEAALLAVQQAEKQRTEKMNKSALKIQSKYRSYKKRKQFLRTRKLILRVQATVNNI